MVRRVKGNLKGYHPVLLGVNELLAAVRLIKPLLWVKDLDRLCFTFDSAGSTPTHGGLICVSFCPLLPPDGSRRAVTARNAAQSMPGITTMARTVPVTTAASSVQGSSGKAV